MASVRDVHSFAVATATEHGVQHGFTTVPLPDRVPLSELSLQVEYHNDMWWTMPPHHSTGILTEWYDGALQVTYVWDWQDCGQGSYSPDGETTTLSRYSIDFAAMYQRNIDNGFTRRVRIVHILS